MHISHFEQVAPVCPVCRTHPLRLGQTALAEGDDIREGSLLCTNPRCQREHPILDGIPILVPDLNQWLEPQLHWVLRRQDITPFALSMLTDILGAGSVLDRELGNLSTYTEAHWGAEATFAPFLDGALSLLPEAPAGPAIDVGCSVGRGTFELARLTGQLTIGVDLNFSMLRLAEQLRRSGKAAYPRRRVGIVFDEAVAKSPYPPENVSFWCADIAALPFRDASFGTLLSLNIIDCLATPQSLLTETRRLLNKNGQAILATPFDWAVNASPAGAWIGGHSQRTTPGAGSSVEMFRYLLPHLGLQLVAEENDLRWRLRVHERSTTEYSVYAAALRTGM